MLTNSHIRSLIASSLVRGLGWRMHIYCLIVILGHSTSWASTSYFEHNETCSKAYQSLISLRFDEAQSFIALEKEQNEGNLTPTFLESYIDFFTIYIQEQSSDMEAFKSKQEERIDAIKKGDNDSPYYLYYQAEMNLHKAFARLKFEEYWSAFWEVRRAYKLLKKNQRKFPDFMPNYKSLGIIHALVGTVPDSYSWGLSILGLSGDVKVGMQQIESYLQYSQQNDKLFFEETQLIYAFFLIYVDKKEDKALQLITEDMVVGDNLLSTFVVADVAHRLHQNDFAIEVLENRPRGVEYIDFYFLDYLLGLMKLNRLDRDADEYFLSYVNNFKGRFYLKEAYQRLSWHHLMKGDTLNYQHYIAQCISKGVNTMDSDKQAQKEAESGQIPNVSLLKARLLFDGGYFSKSFTSLEQMEPSHFIYPKDSLEFLYRRARALEGMKDYTAAITAYLATIAYKDWQHEYFAPKAALLLAQLYEQQSNKAKAIIFYKKCINYYDYPYENSLNQQAKAGLNRLN